MLSLTLCHFCHLAPSLRVSSLSVTLFKDKFINIKLIIQCGIGIQNTNDALYIVFKYSRLEVA